VTITNIVVTDPKVTVIGNPIASLAVGATNTATITASYILTQADIDAGQVTNSALAIGKDPKNNDVKDISGTAVDNDTPTVIDLSNTLNPKIALVKTGVFVDENKDGFAQVGETIKYAFAVTNTGNVTITNIVVTDPKVTVIGNPIASLAVGATNNTTITASYILTQADIDAGQVTNSALAIGKDPKNNDVKDISGTAVDNDTPTVIDLSNTLNPKIALVKTGIFVDENKDGFAQVGETINYAFAVTNTGNVTITNIVVSDPKVTVVGNPIASLAVGATNNTTITASYILTQADIDAGQVTNSALAIGKDPKNNDVKDISGTAVNNDTPTNTSLTQNPGLTITKTSNTPYYSSVGDIIVYTILVKNTGNVVLHDIVVTDPLTGLNTTIQSLAPGSTQEFTENYTVTQSDRETGFVTNVAAAIGLTPNGTPTNPTEASVTIEAQIVLGCGTINVHNAFSPNGDGINELFIIDNIDDLLCFPNNTVEIYNRWGVLVFETTGYDNVTRVFRGISEGRSTISQSSGLPAGTYYYILSYTSITNTDQVQTNKKDGYLYLSR
jgi:gliding motility-associated-like protein/uncharacterized repeat protein (TIGR01451 family)